MNGKTSTQACKARLGGCVRLPVWLTPTSGDTLPAAEEAEAPHRPARACTQAWASPRLARGKRPSRPVRGALCRAQALPCRARPRPRPNHHGGGGDARGGNHGLAPARGLPSVRHGTRLGPGGRTSHLPLPRQPASLSVSCSCLPSLSVVVDIKQGNLADET